MELIKSDATPEADNRGRQTADKQSVISEKQVQRVCAGLLCGDAQPELRSALTEPTSGQARAERGSPNKKQSGCTGTSSEGLPDGRPGKKKHRRRPSKKKRRWKPYFKLTWEEKKELDERETARASRVRAEMFAKGLPVAPYNTTQFLMEEHDREEPDLNTELCGRRGFGASRSEDTASEEEHLEAEEEEEEEEDGGGGGGGGGEGGGGSDGMGRAGRAGGEFLQRDFCETYERYHVETLQNMSKQELVREYLELEKCMSRLEEENNWLRRTRRSAEDDDGGGSAQRVHELESEVERLTAQNRELRYRACGLNGGASGPDTGAQ